MVKKKAFALRLDTHLLEAIEKWAADEFRSTNGQIEWIIQQTLSREKRLPNKKTSITEEENNLPQNEEEDSATIL